MLSKNDLQNFIMTEEVAGETPATEDAAVGVSPTATL